LLPSTPSDDVLLSEKDFYVRMKELEAQLETLNIQEEYIKDEQKNLKRELLRAQEEVCLYPFFIIVYFIILWLKVVNSLLKLHVHHSFCRLKGFNQSLL
jgi:hypothetical protein